MLLKLIVLCFIMLFSCSVIADDLCATPGCVHAASKILDKIDQSVEPCDDFYNFACGTFVKETIIPDDEVKVDGNTKIYNKLQQQLRALLSSPIEEYEINPFKLMKKLYKACMNTTLIEERGLQPLLDIQQSLGGWPVVTENNWNNEIWTWQSAAKELFKLGYSASHLFSFSIEQDWKNSTKSIIWIGEASLALNRDYMIQQMNSTIVQAYHSYQVDIAVLLGADRSRAENEMKQVLEFEFALANISSENNRDITAKYNPITLNDLQTMYPYIQWVDYFNDIFQGTVNVTADENVIVTYFNYFDELEQLIENTPKRTIASYLMWRMTMDSILFMTKELTIRNLKFIKIVNGLNELEPRWKQCVNVVSSSLNIANGAFYVRNHFEQESKAIAMDMFNNIKNEFEINLRNVPWMDETTKAAGLDKLKSMSTNIGYPNELMDDNKLIEYYQALDIDENKYLEAMLKLNIFYMNRAFNKFREPVNKTDWTAHADSADVNAFYSSIENSIQIPAGILQGQFFSADRPNYMNYGAIGFVIGHEITHGFDDQGRQYDSNGNLVDWWQEDTKLAYLEKVECIIEQYGNYTDPNANLPLNANNTLGENIADNGGLKVSYRAYKKWVKINGQESKLPGLNYSSNQIFWITAAQTWCSVARPESSKLSILNDNHSPEKFRVLGTLSNLKEFSLDFNCPLRSPMNPEKKCEVW